MQKKTKFSIMLCVIGIFQASNAYFQSQKALLLERN